MTTRDPGRRSRAAPGPSCHTVVPHRCAGDAAERCDGGDGGGNASGRSGAARPRPGASDADRVQPDLAPAHSDAAPGPTSPGRIPTPPRASFCTPRPSPQPVQKPAKLYTSVDDTPTRCGVSRMSYPRYIVVKPQAGTMHRRREFGVKSAGWGAFRDSRPVHAGAVKQKHAISSSRHRGAEHD